jgi:RNA polymerase sigma-70 factor (ECF subfamily)
MSEEGDQHIASTVAGDPRAAEELLVELIPRVRNLVRYLVRDAEVDDLTQDSLVIVLRNLRSYRGEGSFTAWVDRIVVREVFARVRRRREELMAEPDDQALPLDEDDDFLARRRMIALLDELPAGQRQALVLHYVLEMSVPEVAAELGIPLEAVRSRLRYGRARLRARGLEGLETAGDGDEG